MAKKAYSLDTKEMIIESAIDVIGRKGYSKTTLEDIVQNIGLTRGAFYWHFKDKSDVLEEILQRYECYYLEIDKVDILDSAYDTLRNMIVRNLKSKIERKNNLPYLVRYHIEAHTAMTHLIDQQRYLDEELIKTISNQISRGIQQGEFSSSIDPEACALFIMMNLIGFDDYIMLHNNREFHDPRIPEINIFHHADYILKVLM